MNVEKMVQEYGPYIYRYALKLTCDPQKAEDIAQDTFFSAWKNREQLENELALKKWLQTICYRQFLMDYRKNVKANEELMDDVEALEADGKLLTYNYADPEEEILVEESIRGIQNGCFYAMVRRLSLQQRITFSLVDMFGLGIDEVAELLQLSTGATKGLLHRARKNLYAFFADHCNLLDSKNPCSCQAWLDFRSTHERNQRLAKEKIQTLDNLGEKVQFDEQVRDKIHYLYTHMPEMCPDTTWFDNIINSLQ